jgi:hypothetical protein
MYHRFEIDILNLNENLILKCYTVVSRETNQIIHEQSLTEVSPNEDFVDYLSSFKDKSTSSINVRYKNLNKLYF